MHAPLRSGNASRSNACGWHWITLVPTARLELAQLSPLPPQDSVSTNFTTSALSCNPGKQLLIAANRFKTRIITGLTSLFNAQKPILAKIYFGTSEPGADEATGAEAVAADAGTVAGAVTAALPSTPAEAVCL
jgi:hypothetical protein